jgi:hypothetical protein
MQIALQQDKTLQERRNERYAQCVKGAKRMFDCCAVQVVTTVRLQVHALVAHRIIKDFNKGLG